MDSLRLRSYAKINWFLHVGARRDDGFHELETVFQTVSLHDDLVIRRADAFSLSCDRSDIPTDDRNLVTRAWQALSRIAAAPPVAIELTKRIPAGGGLGGGSSNAAATLLALRRLFDLSISDEALHDIALTLGSDVPFFLLGGTAYGTGRGEELVPLPDIPLQHLMLLLPPFGVPTADAYRELAADRGDGTPVGEAAGLERVRAAIERGEVRRSPWWRNDLERPAFRLRPELGGMMQTLTDCGASFAMMSGSGSTLFARFDDPRASLCAEKELDGDAQLTHVTTVGRATAMAGLR